jgi:outer membrane lipoprotein-sorting protein
MIMDKIGWISIFLLLVFNAQAQQDPKATSILDKVSQQTQSYSTIKADFDYVFESLQQKMTDTVKGTIFIKGDKYKLFFSGYERYFDGEKIITFLLDAGEATIAMPKKSDDELNPSDIFTIYKQNYKYKYIEDASTGNQHIVDLFPNDIDKRKYTRIRIGIDKKSNQIKTIKQFFKDGNRITVDITKLEPNVKIADKLFVFDPKEHPKVEIIDLRK